MSRSSEGPSVLKHKRQDYGSQADTLTEHERRIYDAIRSTKDMGINKQAIKRETNLTIVLVNKSLKTLVDKKKIKVVKGISSNARWGLYMAVEFEASDEITGGTWYEDGNLDVESVNVVKKLCVMFINKHEVATLKEILAEVERTRILNDKLAPKDMKELLQALVLDNKVMKAGADGYKCCKRGTSGEPKLAAMASIPCGVCPRINQCTPDGVISPGTCEHFKKWLDF
ncbi:uncharacterized protein LOC126797283 [Argentina anserina]|uniref:uncharacterized protein LOC126797283 n=1 Tax=Argentina anserina TaxID=57926 RepID=UPI0021763BAA|nr:uncharacterized protein LOC126797283 [Potentilla anserina]